jgi:hypothetical protein
MDVENLAKELILKNMTPEQQMAVLDSVRSSLLKPKKFRNARLERMLILLSKHSKRLSLTFAPALMM